MDKNYFTIASYGKLTGNKYCHIATHNVQVMVFIMDIAKRLKLPEKIIYALCNCSLIWNIGRIAIDNTFF